jgi:hypothetical protein
VFSYRGFRKEKIIIDPQPTEYAGKCRSLATMEPQNCRRIPLEDAAILGTASQEGENR